MSSVTLYRKYRPQSFAEIVNQDHVKTTIQQEILTGKLPHAFLFYGPRGIGKTTTARVLAKALNCKDRQEGNAEPCNKCESCISVTAGKSLNLVEVDAASQTGVDNVRDNIIANARVAVNSEEYKVFIIDEVHMLSTSSFNALLKTLEEPPERVVFVLATTEIHKIPETIISRCQRFDLHPVAADILADHLKFISKKEEREIEDEVITAIVKKSAGHVRDAISLLGQLFSLPGKVTAEAASFILPISNIEKVITFFSHVSTNQAAETMVFLDKEEKQGIRPYQFCQELIDFAHKLLLFTVGSHPEIFKGEVNDDLMPTVQEIASRYTPDKLLFAIDVLMKRRRQLKDYNQGKLPLELAVIELISGPARQTAPVASPVQSPPPVSPPAPIAPQLPVAEKKTPEPVNPPPSVPPEEAVSAEAMSASEAVKVVDEIVPPKKAEKKPDVTTSSEPIGGSDKEPASYSELTGHWRSIVESLDHENHSLCIILQTADLRKVDDATVELAFPFQMHHDHAKRSAGKIIEATELLIPGKTLLVCFKVDPNVKSKVGSDVSEPNEEEKEAMSIELNSLADAFGGSVME